MSNQVSQPPQTSHSPHCHSTRSPTPSPSLRNNPETIAHSIIHTHQILPGIPFEIPCPICQRAIERGEYHHHSETDIIHSVSMDRRAHRELFDTTNKLGDKIQVESDEVSTKTSTKEGYGVMNQIHLAWMGKTKRT